MEKRICILYTGGTIGMVPTERGYAPKRKRLCTLERRVSGSAPRHPRFILGGYAPVGCGGV